MSAKLQFLVIHCTATPEGREITSDMIRQWHMGPAQNPDGTFTYKATKYATKDLLPKEKIGGIDIIKLIPGRGWTRVGYADMIHLDGKVENLMPYNEDDMVDPWEITYGVLGSINAACRHVVYAGGNSKVSASPKDTRTDLQRLTLANYVKHTIASHPDILIAGHNQFQPKACPSFDVRAMCKGQGIADKNIYSAPLQFKFV